MNQFKVLRNLISLLVMALLVVGCANKVLVTKDKPTNHGRYKVTKDYGPDAVVDVSHVKNAVPKEEPLSRGGNRKSYEVLGKRYSVMDSASGFKERGGASWYGKKFHGYLTANGEKYDMYGMTAAHKSLPIPTYVKVTNLANNKHIIVRVNDRGPFHKGRVIDLSYAAAAKLDMLNSGTAQVEVEAINAKVWNSIANKSAQPKDATPIGKKSFVTTSINKPTIIDNLQKSQQQLVAKKTVSPALLKASNNVASGTSKKAARTDRFLGIHYIQVGVYSSEEAAHAVTLRVNNFELPVLISEIKKDNRELFKVILGPMKSRSKTQTVKMQLADLGFSGVHLVDLPK
ncbi:MAG: septal ring lytic transglycosylase RlpA family protein [Oceanospirillaceae bacterium]